MEPNVPKNSSGCLSPKNHVIKLLPDVQTHTLETINPWCLCYKGFLSLKKRNAY